MYSLNIQPINDFNVDSEVLAFIKSHLRVTSTSQDDYITRLIVDASLDILKLTKYAVLDNTYKVTTTDNIYSTSLIGCDRELKLPLISPYNNSVIDNVAVDGKDLVVDVDYRLGCGYLFIYCVGMVNFCISYNIQTNNQKKENLLLLAMMVQGNYECCEQNRSKILEKILMLRNSGSF